MRCLTGVLAVGLLAILTACGTTGAGTLVDRGDTAPNAGGAIPIAERQTLPVLDGTTLDGESASTSDFTGKVLVINVWGSWCGPCRAEAPLLRELSRRTAGKGVQFLGINTRDKDDAARAFEDRFEIPYPSLIDEGGRLTVQLNGIVPVNSVPSTIAVDRSGRVAAVAIGEVTGSQLLGLLEAADPATAARGTAPPNLDPSP
jgi:thiol-disulfide isomerase/thioredoxin